MDDTRPSLLVRLRDPRDSGAWGAFVDVYGPVVYAACRRLGLRHEDAEDVTQRVFARAVNGLREFTYDKTRGRFRDWIGTVIRNEVYRFGRGTKNREQGQADSALDRVAAPVADDTWDVAVRERVLQVALDRCRPTFESETWAAFEGVWLGGRPAVEVAKSLGIPIDKVYVAKSRVLKKLTAEVAALSEDLP
ncbi:MAG: sigma-70 family RNA polymerase sigma factor [Gemmataceae bacterium]|nr:sigma-70 family RNA polymerase sigma factor [Gemmataceae bacterium]